jgi:two-component system OmpR family sensor kinase/two-component system sensor histidine kinase BaeS
MHPHDHPPFSRPHHFPPRHWKEGRRFFWPFAIFFGGITFLFLAAIGIIIYFAVTLGDGRFHASMLLFVCAVPIAFFIITAIIGSFTFRRFGRPMTNIFSAIDSVSEGDLSVRVPEHYPRQFGQLAKRFNHMVSELERADQQRRNLTADIAHELCTPLHIIQGNLEGILDGVYQATPDHINNTLDETQLLARLVNDLQTLSLAEAGQLPLHTTRFLLADLMDDLTSSFSSQAASFGINLTTDTNDPNHELNADYDRLNQVLSNLISNSIRHTPQGGTIALRAESTSNGTFITLHDTGAGIPKDDLPFVFDRFWRGDKSRTDRTHSGLGLAIAKQIIIAHHGKIEVQSEPGEGTTFTIELPEQKSGTRLVSI